MPTITHRIRVADAQAHLLGVETAVTSDAPLPDPLVLFMPVWTPGSYLVREYARHVEGFVAEAGGAPARARKVRKNAWAVEHAGARGVTVRYRLYANDLTVRTNHVDATHAYWNGGATFLAPEAWPGLGARVEVALPGGWTTATALRPDPGAPDSFVADSFDELCDSPFECGPLVERSFETAGRPHRLAVWNTPDAAAVDWDRVAADTRRIVEAQTLLVAGPDDSAASPPYDAYLFLWHVTPRNRGGLEHRACATLQIPADKLGTRAGWLDLLSLVAHELFHLWNVKRVRPAGLHPYRYEEENYTRLLWWFEGGTSYYDFRTLRRAGLATAAEWLAHLGDALVRLEDTPGAIVHSLEDASFDAWIKAYRPDENTPNSTVSYYLKGEVVCALLDLEIRSRSDGRASLDDVVRRLWREYGRAERPVPEDAMPDVIASVAGCRLDDRLDAWVRSPGAIDANEVLARAGLRFDRRVRDGAPRCALGVRASSEVGRVVVDSVLRGSAAHGAGIDARDEIVAVGDRRVEAGRLDAVLARLEPGARVPVLVARDGRVIALEATLDAAPGAEGIVVPVAGAGAAECALCAAWLGEDVHAAARGAAQGGPNSPKSG